MLAGAKDEERETAAQRLSERIKADVILSSRVEETDGKRSLQPEFYLFSRLAPEAGESIGRYTFGAPILLPADLTTADAVTRDSVAKQLTDRAQLLERLLLALREDVLGRHDSALALLERLENDLGVRGLADEQLAARAQTVSALDTLYYFLGREKLFLGRNADAEADAQRAIVINDHDPRAWIILGGALMQQSLSADPAAALEPEGLLDRAEQAYGEAVRLSPDSSTANTIARLALGNVHVARGATLYVTGQADDQAEVVLQGAVAELTPLLDALTQGKQYRMLAQARSIWARPGFTRGPSRSSKAQPTRPARCCRRPRRTSMHASRRETNSRRTRRCETRSSAPAAGQPGNRRRKRWMAWEVGDASSSIWVWIGNSWNRGRDHGGCVNCRRRAERSRFGSGAGSAAASNDPGLKRELHGAGAAAADTHRAGHRVPCCGPADPEQPGEGRRPRVAGVSFGPVGRSTTDAREVARLCCRGHSVRVLPAVSRGAARRSHPAHASPGADEDPRANCDTGPVGRAGSRRRRSLRRAASSFAQHA